VIKKEGVGNVVTRVVMTIVMVLVAPLVFKFLLGLQTAIVTEDALGISPLRSIIVGKEINQ
jgi:hypothetical protein